MRGKDKGRKTVVLKCPSCGDEFEKPKNQTHLQKSSSWTSCSMSCMGKFSSKIQHDGKTSEVKAAISENVIKEYVKYPDDNSEETHNEDP